MATAKKTTTTKTAAKKAVTAAKKTTAKKTTTAAKRTSRVSGSQVGDPAEGLVAPAEGFPGSPDGLPTPALEKKKGGVVGRSTGEKRGTVARYTTQGRQTEARVSEARTMSLDEVAAHAMKGKMGTGRDRDDALRQAGHDPAEVTKLMAKLTKESKPEATKLRIPNNRRGSSWT
jgi:hypothetical protein